MNRGFTLVEIILYITIVSVLLVVIVQYWNGLVGNAVRIRLEQDAQDSSRFAVETIGGYIRQATGVSSPGLGATGTVLQLAMPDAADDPTIIDVDSGTLRVTEGNDGPFEIIPEKVEITNIEFSNLTASTSTPGVVQVNFIMTALQPTAGQFTQISKTIQTSFALRTND